MISLERFWNFPRILRFFEELDDSKFSKSLTLNNLEKEKKRNQINVFLNLEDFFIGRLVVSHLDLVTTSIPKNSIHGIPGCFPNCIVEGRARMKIDKIDE